MSTDPQVTIVIPAWNIGAELTEAVASAFDQGQLVRVVVVDNASDGLLPDAPGERLRLDTRVSVGLARNAGLEAVTTPYVMFLDADDRLLEGTVDFLVGQLEARPDAVIACCTPTGWDPVAGRPITDRRPYPPSISYRLCRYRRAFALANLCRNLLSITGCVVIRTDVARDAGGFADSNFGQDWALGAMIAFRGRALMFHRPGSLYSMTGGSLSGRGRWHDIAAVRSEIRTRARRDRCVPRWVRLLLPVVAMAQLASGLRRLRYRRPGGDATADLTERA